MASEESKNAILDVDYFAEIQLSKAAWDKYSEEEKDIYYEKVFRYYRKNGFPIYEFDYPERVELFDDICNTDCTGLLQGDIITQNLTGSNLASCYFPHMWSINCRKMSSPMEVFSDDAYFMKAIRKNMKLRGCMSDASIRNICKIVTGAQGVSNFRPTAAACVYNNFCNPGDVVWDMSSGFGGRLFGFLASHAGKYIGTDPSSQTHSGLLEIKKDFAFLKKDIELYKCGSEDYVPENNSLDLCFTSPPYFDCEQYSDEPTQSFIKYKTKNLWLEGFMAETLLNCYYGIKPEKYVIINIANTDKYKNLVDDVIKLAESIGFIFLASYRLALSNLVSGGYKYEPVLIFSKE